jgi:hypothetical protein
MYEHFEKDYGQKFRLTTKQYKRIRGGFKASECVPYLWQWLNLYDLDNFGRWQ